MPNDTTRVVSDEQFSNACAIDPLRADLMLQGMADYHNDIPPGGVRQRWIEQTFVLGYSPIGVERAGAQPYQYRSHEAPWMNAYNASGSAVNKWRHKGHHVPSVDPEDVASGFSPQQMAWTTSFWSTHSRKINTICVMLGTTVRPGVFALAGVGTCYRNNFRFNHGGVVPDYAGDWCSDIIVEMLVDSPAAPEDAAQSALIVDRFRFDAEAYQFSEIAMPNNVPGGDDLVYLDYPDAGGSPSPDGLVIMCKPNVRIPQRSRVRFALLLPRYDSATYTTPWTEPGAETNRYIMNQHYSVTVHTHLALQRGKAQ